MKKYTKAQFLKDVAAEANEEIERLRDAILYTLSSVDHPNFTDRHGIIEKMKSALNPIK